PRWFFGDRFLLPPGCVFVRFGFGEREDGGVGTGGGKAFFCHQATRVCGECGGAGSGRGGGRSRIELGSRGETSPDTRISWRGGTGPAERTLPAFCGGEGEPLFSRARRIGGVPPEGPAPGP